MAVNLSAKTFWAKLILVTLVILAAFSATAFAKETPDETRAKLNRMSTEVLERMYKAYPASRSEMDRAYAYSTISSSSVKLGFWGSDRGRGIAVNNETGEKIYVKMSEITIGLNIGAKEYDLLFIIQNKAAWDRFISGNIKFGTEATAAATDGVSGGAVADAKIIANGVWVYQIDKKGLALELTFKGAQIKPIKSLNE